MAKRSDKLNKLRSIVNGTLKLEAILPPKHYTVWHEWYMVDGVKTNEMYEVEGKELTPDQYEVWKQANVREIDFVFIISGAKSYATGSASLTQYQPEPIKIPENKANKEPKRTKKHKAKADKIEANHEPVIPPSDDPEPPPIPNAGMMSEYGKTWKFSWDTTPLMNSR